VVQLMIFSFWSILSQFERREEFRVQCEENAMDIQQVDGDFVCCDLTATERDREKMGKLGAYCCFGTFAISRW